eukprot:702842-Pleurochrysis_carterae.AAC.5
MANCIFVRIHTVMSHNQTCRHDENRSPKYLATRSREHAHAQHALTLLKYPSFRTAERSSALRTSKRISGYRSRARAITFSLKSIPSTRRVPQRRASSSVVTPRPQPTSQMWSAAVTCSRTMRRYSAQFSVTTSFVLLNAFKLRLCRVLFMWATSSCGLVPSKRAPHAHTRCFTRCFSAAAAPEHTSCLALTTALAC